MALFDVNRFCSMSRGVSTRRTSARRATALSAAFIVLFGCGGGGQSLGQCLATFSCAISAPPIDLSRDNIFNVGSREQIEGDIEGRDGNDTFNIIGSFRGDVLGGNGNDIFNFNGGRVVGDVLGGNGNDTFNLNDVQNAISGNIEGESGNDIFNLTSGSFEGNVTGGTGDDIFIIDVISLVNLMIDGDIDGGADTDMLRYFGAPATGNVFDRGTISQFGEDMDITDNSGRVRNFESQIDRNIESQAADLAHNKH